LQADTRIIPDHRPLQFPSHWHSSLCTNILSLHVREISVCVHACVCVRARAVVRVCVCVRARTRAIFAQMKDKVFPINVMLQYVRSFLIR